MTKPAPVHDDKPMLTAAVTIADIGGPVASLHRVIAQRWAGQVMVWPVVAEQTLFASERTIEQVSRIAGPMSLFGAYLALGYVIFA